MMIATYAEPENKEHENNPCELCGAPGERTEFHCDKCEQIFWVGYLCTRAQRNPPYVLLDKLHVNHTC